MFLTNFVLFWSHYLFPKTTKRLFKAPHPRIILTNLKFHIFKKKKHDKNVPMSREFSFVTKYKEDSPKIKPKIMKAKTILMKPTNLFSIFNLVFNVFFWIFLLDILADMNLVVRLSNVWLKFIDSRHVGKRGDEVVCCWLESVRPTKKDLSRINSLNVINDRHLNILLGPLKTNLFHCFTVELQQKSFTLQTCSANFTTKKISRSLLPSHS